jgi:hypothetical protein
MLERLRLDPSSAATASKAKSIPLAPATMV